MKTFAVTVTRGAKHPDVKHAVTVRAADKRAALFIAINHVRQTQCIGANVALFATAVDIQQSLRKQVIDRVRANR